MDFMVGIFCNVSFSLALIVAGYGIETPVWWLAMIPSTIICAFIHTPKD